MEFTATKCSVEKEEIGKCPEVLAWTLLLFKAKMRLKTTTGGQLRKQRKTKSKKYNCCRNFDYSMKAKNRKYKY